MGTYTTNEVKDIMILMDTWKGLEHDKWKLISFDDDEAKFGWLDRGLQFTKYVVTSRYQINFFRGVEPDVLDQF